MTINELARLESSKPYVFFHVGDFKGQVVIRRVGTDTIWVDYSRDLFLQREIECFVVLSSGSGIYQFVGEVLAFGPVAETKVDIVGIRVVPGSGKTINRREFVRIESSIPCQMTITKQRDPLDGKLVNLSANGACLESHDSWSMDEFFELEFKSDITRPIHFKTAFKVIHDELVAETKKHQLGVVFLKNIESSEISSLSDVKQREIVRWIDYLMIDRRKNGASQSA